MPNQLNKDRNKIKEKDEIHTAQEILILHNRPSANGGFSRLPTDTERVKGHRQRECIHLAD